MDLLHSRYASPLEFMRLYIEQGRFGEFVTEILDMDSKRKEKEKEEKEDNKLWLAYLLSMSDETFHEWKKDLVQIKKPVSYSMTNAQVEATMQNAKGILKKISPV